MGQSNKGVSDQKVQRRVLNENLTEKEISELIDSGVAAIYERAYNEALDDVIKAAGETNDPKLIIDRIKGLRKTWFTSSPLPQ